LWHRLAWKEERPGHWSPMDAPTGGTTHLASLCGQTHSRPESTALPFSRVCPEPFLALTDSEGHHTPTPRQSEYLVLSLRPDLLSFPAFYDLIRNKSIVVGISMRFYLRYASPSLSTLTSSLPFASYIKSTDCCLFPPMRILFSQRSRPPSI
jgi:hypothetical protein